MKILVLSKYSRKGASSRFRMFQFFPGLHAAGIEIISAPLFGDDYLNRLYSKQSRLLSVLMCYFGRTIFLLGARNKHDLIWLEKELFPWIPWSIEKWFYRFLNTPYIVEYDDAIFHQYDQHRLGIVRTLLGEKCDRVIENSELFLGGNEYLASRAKSAGAKAIVKIPTVVSSKNYFPRSSENTVPVIGWIGSMSTSIYLEKLRPVLKALSLKHSFIFRVVGATLDWDDVPIECIPWSESKEVELVQSFDIGVMPLIDSSWERGKCGFKLVQYMACGKPVVADAIGANLEIVSNGRSGFLVANDDEWFETLSQLLNDNNLRASMGAVGHQRFVERYSLEIAQTDLLKMFFTLGKKANNVSKAP